MQGQRKSHVLWRQQRGIHKQMVKKKKSKNCKKINYKRTKTINLISLQPRCVHLKGEEVGKDDDVPWKRYQWGSWFMHAGSSAWAQIIMAVCWQD